MNKTILFFMIFFNVVILGCTPKSETKSLYIVHIGEQDKPIKNLCIHTNHFLVGKNDIGLEVTEKIFSQIEKYVRNNNMNEEQSNKDFGTFQILINSDSDSLIYIIPSENACVFFKGLSEMINDEPLLYRAVKKNIVDRICVHSNEVN